MLTLDRISSCTRSKTKAERKVASIYEVEGCSSLVSRSSCITLVVAAANPRNRNSGEAFELNLSLSRYIKSTMFGMVRCFPSIERIKLESFTLPQKPLIPYRNSRRLPAAIRTSAPFSTTARRKQQREATTWDGLEWVGSPEWLDAYMTPRKPLKP